MSSDLSFQSKSYAAIVADLLHFLREGRGWNRALTDTTEGSVVRTLTEAYARELAVAHDQLNRVYLQSFLATASGSGLDNVVALLGLQRRPTGHYEGTVELRRTAGIAGDIHVPAGTRVVGRSAPACELVEAALLTAGADSVQVSVRSLEPPGQNDPDEVKANALTGLERPVAGIASATNPGALRRSDKGESDEELRTRARNTAAGIGSGTPAAIRRAVRSCGVQTFTLEETEGSSGVIVVRLADPDITEAVRRNVEAAVEQVRPAGIRARVECAGIVKVWLKATLNLRAPLDVGEVIRVKADVLARVGRHFEMLGLGDSVRLAPLRAVLLGPPEIATIDQEKSTLSDGKETLDFTSEAGTLPIEPTQRAVLATDQVSITLNPPRYVVSIDVVFRRLTRNTKYGDDSDSRLMARMRSALDAALVARYGKDTVTWKHLAEPLTPFLDMAQSSLAFTLIHEWTGVATDLWKDGDGDVIAAGQEELTLRYIRFPDHG